MEVIIWFAQNILFHVSICIYVQEVPGMGFHISQPGSSVATSLIEGESKEKHVLLLEIKVESWAYSKSYPAEFVFYHFYLFKDVLFMCLYDV